MTERYDNFQELLQVKRGNYGVVELPIAKKNAKGAKVTLTTDALGEQVINLPMKNDKGNTVYRPVKFVPGKVYAIPKDDVVFLDTLKLRSKIKKAYSTQLVKDLEDAKVPHEVIKCKSCGGRVTKVEIERIEVIASE